MMTTENTMKYVRVETVPGMTTLRLTEEWQGLPAGTEVRPVSSGHNGAKGRDERTVTVLTGELAGRQVTGPA